MKLLETISNAEFDFKDKVWAHISSEAKDFISKCLIVDPAERWSASQLLSHKWLA